MPSHQQTLEQRRAAEAWRCVTVALDQAKQKANEALQKAQKPEERSRLEQEIRRLNTDSGKLWASYGSLARKVPALVTSAGLGQAMAFLRAKGQSKAWDPHELLYSHVSDWVVGQLKETGELLDVIQHRSSEVYRQATSEALAFLLWVKRFAEARLPEATEGP
ncbi:MAG: type III-B CRISPR module-associated protein Cmr5 [Bacillota bacterium]|nr:type III-B CRISPR module-associated protein Cmr5 [Bacillota bacterium]